MLAGAHQCGKTTLAKYLNLPGTILLKWFRDNIAKNKHFVGVVLYTGEQLASFGEAMWAIPINVLWTPN